MDKRGFTLIEVLVGGIILVIAIALIAVLYGKAGRIRTIVASQNEVQLTLSSMLDTIRTGAGHNLEGLAFATSLYIVDADDIIDDNNITFGNVNYPNKIRFEINSTNKTVYKKEPPSAPTGTDLDINNKIDIESGSKFYFYDQSEGPISIPVTVESVKESISKVVVCLVGRSTMGAIQKTVTLYSTIRLRNINPL